MATPYTKEVAARHERTMHALVSRPAGATILDISQALGVVQSGASYRANAKVKAGKWHWLFQPQSTCKRFFLTQAQMLAWRDSQAEDYPSMVLRLLREKQPINASMFAEAAGLQAKHASGYLEPMRKRGEIFGVKVKHTWWWYSSERAANQGKAEAVAEMEKVMANRTKKAVKARWGGEIVGNAPVVIYDRSVSFREREATIPDNVKRTIAKTTHIHRWQSVPDSGVSIFADHPGYGA
jgi:hypothetical protein